MTLIPKIVERTPGPRTDDVLVFAGGIIPPDDIGTLRADGVRGCSPPVRRFLGITAGSIGARPAAAGSPGNSFLTRTPSFFRSTGGSVRVSGQAAVRALRDPRSAGEAVETVDDAVAAADRVGYPVVVKAQVQVGGRGKAGGIKLATDADEARTHAGNISAWTSRATS